MDRKLGHFLRVIRQGLRWGLLTGVSAIAAIGLETLPAVAAELMGWDYDAEARSLTVTLPSNISPSVSVLASDQLLLALPDTQIGDVAGLNVGDGIVENIVLEQSTPDTLWIVMEFAEGTVLASEQRILPVDSTDNAAVGQQWEVRPALAASSRTAPAAADGFAAENASTNAADLRAPEVSIAQADFPDLPILEPGISLTEPISVPPIGATEPSPPINAAPPVNAAPPPPPPMPPAPPTVEASRSEISVPEASVDSDIPAEPPFLGEFEVPVIDEPGIIPETPTAVSVPELDAEPIEMIAEEPPIEADAIAEEPLPEAEQIPVESVAAAPEDPSPNADFVVEPIPVISEFEPEELDLLDQGVTPQNTERWPEPIPFGVPLPQ